MYTVTQKYWVKQLKTWTLNSSIWKSSDVFDIGLCPSKEQVGWRDFEIFLHLPQYKLSSPISKLWHKIGLWLSMCVHLIIIHKIYEYSQRHFNVDIRVRFGDPDHDQVLRTKTWSGAKPTWSSWPGHTCSWIWEPSFSLSSGSRSTISNTGGKIRTNFRLLFLWNHML